MDINNINNLAYFKRWLAEPNATLTITKYLVWQPDSAMADKDGWLRVTHKYEGIPRKVAKLQTTQVVLTDGNPGNKSWLNLDPASAWTYGNRSATRKDMMVIIEYELRND